MGSSIPYPCALRRPLSIWPEFTSHFLTASAVSENASDPVRQLRYDKNDLDLGVRRMREAALRRQRHRDLVGRNQDRLAELTVVRDADEDQWLALEIKRESLSSD